MRYMFLIRSDNSVPPTPALFEAMAELTERETKAGRLIMTGGLMPPEAGFRMGVARGEVLVLDGPFIESKEVIGGYAIFAFQSHEEAMESVREFLGLHTRHVPGWEGTCEARLIMGG